MFLDDMDDDLGTDGGAAMPADGSDKDDKDGEAM
jgi:hypothetical protein